MTRMFDHVVDPDVQFNIRQFIFNKPLETILISSFIFNLLNWFSYRSLFISYLVLILYCKIDVIKGIIFEYIFRNVTEFMIHERNKMVMAPFMKERDIDDDEIEENDFNRDEHEQKHNEESEERENEERENDIPKGFSKEKAYREFMDLLNNKENECGECNCEDGQCSEREEETDHKDNHESEDEQSSEHEENHDVNLPDNRVELVDDDSTDYHVRGTIVINDTDDDYLSLRRRKVQRT